MAVKKSGAAGRARPAGDSWFRRAAGAPAHLQGDRRLVLAEELAHGVRDLAQSGVDTDGGQERGRGVLPFPGRGFEVGDGVLGFFLTALADARGSDLTRIATRREKPAGGAWQSIQALQRARRISGSTQVRCEAYLATYCGTGLDSAV